MKKHILAYENNLFVMLDNHAFRSLMDTTKEILLMTTDIDVVVCDSDPGSIIESLNQVGIKSHHTSDPSDLFNLMNQMRPRITALSISEETRMAEEFCRLLKSKNLSLPFVLYGNDITEGIRLPLLESGADEVFDQEALVSELTKILRLVKNRADNGTKFVMPPKPPSRKNYSSYLPFDHSGISHVLQFIALGGEPGFLEIKFDSDTAIGANVYIRDKRIVHAAYANETGMKALAMMIKNGSGKAGFIPNVESPEESISFPLDHVLIEVAVMADEENADG